MPFHEYQPLVPNSPMLPGGPAPPDMWGQIESILGGRGFGAGLGISMSVANASAMMDWARMGAGVSRAIGEYNAKIKEQQTAIALKETERANDRYMASVDAGFSGAGVTSSGTAMDVLNSALAQGYEQYHRIEQMGQLAAAQARYQGELGAWRSMAEGEFGTTSLIQEGVAMGITGLFA